MLPPRLNELLRQTSRSFYLTLRVVPPAIRLQLSLAYLLARTTDTIADTELVPAAQRREALQQLRDRILGNVTIRPAWAELAQHQAQPTERELLTRAEVTLAELGRLNPADRELVRSVLATIISGQELDLQRFGGSPAHEIVALETPTELEDYTYRVAGCVGEFWTRLTLAHAPNAIRAHPQLAAADLIQLGIRFGQGLQLVNILRDFAADLRQGRCYLPAAQLQQAGLSPAALLHPAQEATFRPVYQQHLAAARRGLAAGWQYTNQLRWAHPRLRLACAWPVLIGLETLDQLERTPALDPNQRVKISRTAVRWILIRSLSCYPLPWIWQRLARPA